VGDIQVDLSAVREFASGIRAEVERSLRPGSEDLFRVYRFGVCFGSGWWRSDVVQAAQWQYHGCLDSAGHALAGVIQEAEVLMAAAEQVASLYAGTDAFASANADEIERVFDYANRAAVRAQLAAQPSDSQPKDVL
jgi:hypothetical protein